MTNSPFISAIDGTQISNDEQLKQSIIDIITTPIGSRLCRRDYGCDFPNLLDKPDNPHLHQRMKAAIAMGIKQWEKRITATKIEITRTNIGKILISITATRNDLPTTPTTTFSFGV